MILHGTVILRRHHRLIPGFPVQPPDDQIKGFSGITSNGDFFRRRPHHRTHLLRHEAFIVLPVRAHVVGAFVIDAPQVGHLTLQRGLGHEAVVAVLKIDVVGL